MRCAECKSEIVSSAAYCPYCGSKVEGALEEEDYTYEAFISYRHLPYDRSVAVRVQRYLEGAFIPQELRRGRPMRLGRLCRGAM